MTAGDDVLAEYDERRRQRRRAQHRAYHKRNPVRRKAYAFVNLALFFGYLTRPSRCEGCGRRCKPEAHHTDYMKPLDVRWLCKTCHESEHHST